MPTITIKSPDKCLTSELSDFGASVLAGGEVTRNGLDRRVRGAHALLFMHDRSCLVGIAALKNPSSTYRTKVFNKANAALSPVDFPLELGWVFVLPSYQGKKLSKLLVQAAIEEAAGTSVFATTRTDNLAMHSSLIAVNFIMHGNNFASNRGAYRLALFVHTVPAA